MNEVPIKEKVADIDLRVRHLEIDIAGLQVNTIAALYRIWQKHNPPRFEWTEAAPTQEGWFWLLFSDTSNQLCGLIEHPVSIVRVRRLKNHEQDGLCVSLYSAKTFLPVDKFENALWSGPITLPYEP